MTFAVLANQTWAQEAWPRKPIRVIVPFGAGSITDVAPRIVFNRISVQVHQPIFVEDRPGAGSTLGAALVAKSPADGYTLLVNSTAQAIAPAIFQHLPYDSNAFTAITPIGVQRIALITSAKRGLLLHDLIRLAKSDGVNLTYGTTGTGSATHLAAESFRLEAGFGATHVSFKGPLEALNEVMEDRIDYCFCAIGSALPLIQDHRLSALAVGGRQRMTALPETPTFSEEGFSDIDYLFWIGAFAPIKTSRGIVQSLSALIRTATETPSVRDQLAKVSVETLHMSPVEFGTYVQRQTAQYAALIRTLGLSLR